MDESAGETSFSPCDDETDTETSVAGSSPHSDESDAEQPDQEVS